MVILTLIKLHFKRIKVKIRVYRTLVIVFSIFTLLALGKCIYSIIAAIEMQSPALDYDVALIGFIGAFTGVCIPLFNAHKEDLVKEEKEMYSLISNVYDELAELCIQFSKEDIFVFDTPAYESFKQNYIHFIAIDKKMSQDISNAYGWIQNFNNKVKEYKSIPASEEAKRFKALIELNNLKSKILDILAGIISPRQVLVVNDGNEKYHAEIVNGYGYSYKTTEKHLEELFSGSTSFYFPPKEKRDENFGKYITKCLVSKFNMLVKKSKSNFYISAKIINNNDDENLLFLFYFMPRHIEQSNFENKRPTNVKASYFDYFTSLQPILLMDGFSPALIDYQIMIHNYKELASYTIYNIYNEDFVYYVFTKCAENKCFKEFFEAFISQSRSDVTIILFNLLIGFKNAGQGYYNRKYYQYMLEGISEIKSENYKEPFNEIVRFVVIYCKNILVNDHNIIEYNAKKDVPFSLLLQTLYNNIYFTPNYYQYYLEKIGKEKMIEMIFNHLKNIKECVKTYRSIFEDRNNNGFIKRNFGLFFPLLNRVPDLYSKLYLLDYDFGKQDFRKLIEKSIKECEELCFIKENKKIWKYRQNYSLTYTAAYCAYIDNKPSNKWDGCLIDKLLFNLKTTAKENRNTIIEEIYYSAYLRAVICFYHQLQKIADKLENDDELRELFAIFCLFENEISSAYMDGFDHLCIELSSSEEQDEGSLPFQFDKYINIRDELRELILKKHK